MRPLTESVEDTKGAVMSACPPLPVLEAAAVEIPHAAAEISAHLVACSICRRTLDDIRLNNSLLKEITAVRRGSRSHRERPVSPPVVADYEILDCVAQGGQGVVYRAIQRRTKRHVALKMLLGGHFATPRQRSRFEREVELSAGLRHPYIVTVHDSGITPDGRPFLSMEFIEGAPLDQWAGLCRAERKGPETIRRLVSVFSKVCVGLGYAHLQGVLHRDLKPGNLLVDANDDPHIVDFGLAKLVDGALAITDTLTGEFMGTVAYAAPEQVSSADCHADARSDVYALGVLLYEVLTGQLPYPVTGALADVVQQITTADPSAPSLLDPFIPSDLDTITMKAMAKDANRRYQSAGDLGEDLRRLLANEPIRACGDSTWYVLRKTARRHRAMLISVALAFLLLVTSALAIGTYMILGARAAVAKAQTVAASERAEAISLVLHSASGSRYRNTIVKGYASRDLHRLATQTVWGCFSDHPRKEAAIASLISDIYRRGDSMWYAESLIRQTNMKGGLDASPKETGRGLCELAEVLLARKRVSEAVQYCEQALSIDKQSGGRAGLDIARDMELLARIRIEQREFGSAAKLAVDAAAIQASILGNESEEIARSWDPS